MRTTKQISSGTSFHDVTIFASVQDLIRVLGQPRYSDNTGKDKVNFEWVMETKDGAVFALYDYKEWRKISEIEVIQWHIGSHSKQISIEAKIELQKALNELFN